MRQDHYTTIRQVHRTVTTVMPLLTAAIAVSGAVLTAMEQKREFVEPLPSASALTREARRRVTAAGFITSLVVLLVKTLLLSAAIAGVGAAIYFGDTTVRAVTITIAVLALLYLAERQARGRRA